MVNITKYDLTLVKEKSARYNTKKTIKGTNDAFDFIKEVLELETKPEEHLMLLTLNTKNMVTGYFDVSKGSINTSIVHPREIYKRALLMNAASIIICHNHPSGDSTPSKEDTNITLRLKECGGMIGINLLDHIIVGNTYCSMKEKKII